MNDRLVSEISVFREPRETAPQSEKRNVQISVLICTHNRTKYLSRAIESVVNQSLSRELYEIIVVDNCSTDNTKEVVTDYVSNGQNLRYFYEPSLGLSHARNRAIQESRSDYLVFLDDDAVADPALLQLYLEAFKNVKPTPACIAGKILLTYEAPKPDWYPQNRGFERCLTYVDYGDADRFLDFSKYEYPLGANMGILKSALLKLGGFKANLGRKGGKLLSGEETKVFYDLYKEGESTYYLSKARVYHAVPRERLTRKYFYRRYFWYGITIAAWRPDVWTIPPRTFSANANQLVRSIYRYLKKRDKTEKFLKACDVCFHTGFIVEKLLRRYSL